MAERPTRPQPATTKPPGWPDDVTLGMLPDSERLIVHARHLGTRIDTRVVAGGEARPNESDPGFR